jgi:hypothetical protein
MSGYVLNTKSVIQCAHGGIAKVATSNTEFMVDNAPALIETDVHQVLGCPFFVGTAYSPCVRIEWMAGVVKTKVNGVPVLLHNSIGKCLNESGAIQGAALITATQNKIMVQ